MVAFNDISRVQQLYVEVSAIDAALSNFDAGGEIVRMSVSGGPAPQPAEPGQPPGRPRMTVTVTTTGMTYPQGMVDAIKTGLNARKTAIQQELTQLGVTNPQ